MEVKMKTKKQNKKDKNRKKLRIRELEKRIVPSPGTGKKPSIPGPYAPGTDYGLAKRKNIVT